MSMLKTVPPYSWDFGEHIVQLIKAASTGLRGNDFKTLVKRAGYNFADMIKKAGLKQGDVPVITIGLGAHEAFGHNRNGDTFLEDICRRYHNTFTKYARWYRNHDNKDTAKSYGLVKNSHFNEDMKRVELFCILNGNKEAADRNGGLVADEEMKLLESDKDIPTSMSCKVSHDICAGCGNKAKTRKDYCLGEDEGGHCKRGGVRNRMCYTHDDGFVNHVLNPDPTFFDISKVFRGADRTSWCLGMYKAASLDGVSGAELAERIGIEMPAFLKTSEVVWPSKLQNLLIKLAQIEQRFESAKNATFDKSFSAQSQTTWHDHNSGVHQALSALAMFKIAMPLDGFASFVNMDKSANVELARRMLPGVYGRMLDEDINNVKLTEYLPCGTVPYQLHKWAADRIDDYSLDRQYVEKRAAVADMFNYSNREVLNKPMLKIAGVADDLCRQYALYKLAFLQSLSNRCDDFDFLCETCVRQNYLK